MAKYRVFLEGVKDPENPMLISRLVKLSKRDESAVAVLLDDLPAILADGVDKDAAERLRKYLEPAGARVMLKAIGAHAKTIKNKGHGANAKSIKNKGHGPKSLNFFKRMSWGIEVFSETWGRQVLLLLVLLCVVIGSEILLGLLTGVPILRTRGPDNPMAALTLLQSPRVVAGLVLTQVVIMLAVFWYQASMIRLVAAFMEEGGTTPLADIMHDGLKRTPELVSAVGLILLPVLLVYGGLGLGLSTLLLPDSPAMLAFSLLLLSLLMLLVFIGFALVGPVSVLESLGPWAVLKRSWTLSRKRRLRIIGNLLLLMIGLLVVVIGVQLIAGLALPASLFVEFAVEGGELLGLPAIIITMLVFLGLYILALFLINFMMTAFYFEARVCNEDWAPAWEMVPHPSWPASDALAEPAAGRGVRAWVELLLFSLLGLALVAGGMALMGSRILSMMPTPHAAGSNMRSVPDSHMLITNRSEGPMPALSVYHL